MAEQSIGELTAQISTGLAEVKRSVAASAASAVTDAVCEARTQNIQDRISEIAKKLEAAEQKPSWFERLQKKAAGITAIVAMLAVLGAFLYHLSKVIVRMEQVITTSTEQMSRDAEEMKRVAGRGPMKIFVPVPAPTPEPKAVKRRRVRKED